MNTHPRTRRLLAALAGITALALTGAALAAGTPAASPAASPAANASMPSHSPEAAPAPAENVVYKWKDAHGVSQYSQQPPPKGVKFEIVPMAASASHASTPPANSGGNF